MTQLQERAGRPSRMNAAFVPFSPQVRPQMSLDTRTNTAGGYLLGLQIADRIATALRSQLVLGKAGAKTLFGLQNDLVVSIQNAYTTATWMAEDGGTNAPQVDSSFSAVKLQPFTLQGVTSISRQLLAQSTPDIEAFLLADLTRAVAVAVDAAGLAGTGNSNQPAGILSAAGTNSVVLGASGAQVAGDNIAEAERLIAIANGAPSALITHPNIRSRMRRTVEFTGATAPLWTTDDKVMGMRALTTTSIPSAQTKGGSSDICPIVIGDFSNCVIGFWDSLELQVDPFSLKKSNMVEISVYCTVAMVFLRPAVFTVIPDARP